MSASARERMVASFDRPGQPDEPDRPDRRGQGRESEASRAERLGLDRLSRVDFYKSQQAEAAAQDAARLDPDRKTPRGAPDRLGKHRPEDKPTSKIESFARYYWTEVPRFFANWHRHTDRWPGRARKSREYDVRPEARAGAADEVAKVPQAEPPVSDDVKKAEEENPNGGCLVGFDFRLKGADRLMEKALEGLEAQPDSTPKEVVGRIPDAIRYTYCFERNDYTAGYLDIKRRLESAGYEMYQSKNSWTDAEYKGINTRWVTAEGQRFEVQFHTPESFHAKHEVTHHAYERLRDPRTSRTERRELKSFQREVSSWIPVPAHAVNIPDYKKDGF